jgi:GNAT superfamily N-acetyltransferase
MNVRVHVPDSPSELHRTAITALLVEFNTSHGFPSDHLSLAVLLLDHEDEVIGGLWGKTGYGWLFVELLVVPERLRGRGFGGSLLERAEQIARDRGCIGSWLTTFTFQAEPFYRRLGYTQFGVLDDSPPGSARLFLRKRF